MTGSLTVARVIFAVALVGTLVAATLPQAVAPTLGDTDKVNHIIAFVVLSALAAWAFPRTALVAIAAAMAALGGAIEGLQAIPALKRSAEWADWRADVVAAVVTLALVALVRACIRPPRALGSDDIK